MNTGTQAQSTATQKDLSQYDIILLIDKSGSMGDPVSGKDRRTRWEASKEVTKALARECAKYDDDGISVVVFAGNFTEYNNVKDDESIIDRIFTENQPSGGTDTAKVLDHVLGNYISKRTTAGTKPIIVLCITDGAPNDRQAVANVIINAANSIQQDNEIGISFLQVGEDASAKDFLKSLDDDLQAKGAKFDIVDTKTFDGMENMSLVEVLLNALND